MVLGLLRRRRWRRRGFRRILRVTVLNGRLATELFVVLVFDDLLQVHGRTVFEVQRVFRDGVGREPILAVDLLPVGLEFREQVFGTLFQVTGAAAVGFDDLKVLVVDPNLALEVAFAGIQLLGFDGEYVPRNLVYHLMAQIAHVVRRDFVRCQYEGLDVAKILFIFGRQDQTLERVGRSVYHLLRA